MMKPDFKCYDNVTKPKHYQGKHGLEAMSVIDNFIFDLAGKQPIAGEMLSSTC